MNNLSFGSVILTGIRKQDLYALEQHIQKYVDVIFGEHGAKIRHMPMESANFKVERKPLKVRFDAYVKSEETDRLSKAMNPMGKGFAIEVTSKNPDVQAREKEENFLHGYLTFRAEGIKRACHLAKFIHCYKLENPAK